MLKEDKVERPFISNAFTCLHFLDMIVALNSLHVALNVLLFYATFGMAGSTHLSQ